jgi:hypothetical protein
MQKSCFFVLIFLSFFSQLSFAVERKFTLNESDQSWTTQFYVSEHFDNGLSQERGSVKRRLLNGFVFSDEEGIEIVSAKTNLFSKSTFIKLWRPKNSVLGFIQEEYSDREKQSFYNFKAKDKTSFAVGTVPDGSDPKIFLMIVNDLNGNLIAKLEKRVTDLHQWNIIISDSLSPESSDTLSHFLFVLSSFITQGNHNRSQLKTGLGMGVAGYYFFPSFQAPPQAQITPESPTRVKSETELAEANTTVPPTRVEAPTPQIESQPMRRIPTEQEMENMIHQGGTSAIGKLYHEARSQRDFTLLEKIILFVNEKPVEKSKTIGNGKLKECGLPPENPNQPLPEGYFKECGWICSVFKFFNSDSNHLKWIRGSYSNEVTGLKKVADQMETQGEFLEDIADYVSHQRRNLGKKYKDLTSEFWRERIFGRNQITYGDPLGPSFEFLKDKAIKKGIEGDQIWKDIIRSSARSNDGLNWLLDNI